MAHKTNQKTPEFRMPLSALTPPTTDPTPIFTLYRGNFATELLTAAVCHFDVFGRLARSPRTRAELAGDLGLADRPTVVLTTALRAMGLVAESDGRLSLTALAHEHLLPGGPFDLGDYIGLAAQNAGVVEMVARLRTNKPATMAGGGMAYIYRAGIVSAMDAADSARHFTLALAGRAKNIAPLLAQAVDLADAETLVDVGGGSGIYAIALLQRYPQLRAVLLDRAEVVKVAEEMADAYGVAERLECRAGDMFAEPLPAADAVLLSNILHDWDVAECRQVIAQCAASLRPGGQVLIHDAYLTDALDGPLPLALYSAALFSLTEGRLYSAAEYGVWLREAGLSPQPVRETLASWGVLAGVAI
jgi:predicted O-methyltransferase YrrM